jgi:hypothetical protein
MSYRMTFMLILLLKITLTPNMPQSEQIAYLHYWQKYCI